jgi:eukaryotic-like serine/threonine-protein kinase
METLHMNEHSIFLAALEISDPHQRANYLDEACIDDPPLRQQVDGLFAAHERSGEFLDVPALKQMAAGSPGGETSVQRHAAQGEIDLSFLEPSTAPGSLGRLRHYEIHEVIGRGGCGIVLKAFDEKLHRIVAIKVMAPELAATSPARKRFLREARATAAIRHENVVSIHAVEEQPLPFLVMEYIDGETLQQRLDRTGPLDIQTVLRIGHQIASGLAAAHTKGLIHRDIKPANILLEDGTDHLKITDFGLARSADDASMTQSGMIAGTPLYMSPEQAQGRDIDRRSDLFSLGSVLYVMCSGRPPFRAATSIAVLRRVVDEQPRPIQGIIPEVPQWLAAIITRLHAKNPEERFASAQEISDLLARCLAELEQHGRVELADGILPMFPQPENATQELASPNLKNWFVRPRSRNWVAAAAMVLVLLTGLGVTEATGVTNVGGTVIRLFSPDGTLVVEVDDPGVSVSIDGEEMVITGTGAREIRLKPGQYKLLASRDGQVVRQELVTVTSKGRRVVRVSREAESPAAVVGPSQSPALDTLVAEQRKALEWVLSVGGKLELTVEGKAATYVAGDPLPEKPFRVNRMLLGTTGAIDDDSVQNLKSMPPVNWIVELGPPAGDGVLAKIATYPGIAGTSNVTLNRTAITDAGLVHLRAFPNLWILTLSETKVSAAGLAHIRDMKFRGLTLDDCKGIDDDACPLLAALPALRWLGLEGTSITDAGLTELAGCKWLNSLNVRRCKVSEAAVKQFAASRPNCRVTWDGGVIEPTPVSDR